MPFAIAYGATAVAFFTLDFIWLSLAVSRIYKPLLGSLLRDSPNLPVAAAFYLVYVVGLVVFAVLPAASAGSWLMALGLGALVGLVAYGTYDFTNLSTIRDWPLVVSLVDLAWGITVSAAAALVGYAVLQFTS
ncbi:hypothetical protein ASD04_12270 [Devosia sp. Root436]|jgi:uncharacterized membrane protein|uniref:DUF2177 family protein n=1 Tax=Devosia sp. Root436 TaxID=1736537 RepID=UPI000701C250|nr:DUF2177 family protein [Devosia sp. Root436]KQX35564.1 hypothetical protein ASD04_12270 [Devosia sp. Root436]